MRDRGLRFRAFVDDEEQALDFATGLDACKWVVKRAFRGAPDDALRRILDVPVGMLVCDGRIYNKHTDYG